MPKHYHCFTFVVILFRRFYRTMVIVIMAVIIGSMDTYVSVYDEAVYIFFISIERLLLLLFVRFTVRSLNQIISTTFKCECYE